MSAIIEVASIRPPGAPRKPGHVIDVSGASFEAWPEKLAKLQVGRRYAIEIEEREFKGQTFRKITKAQPVAGGTNRTQKQTALNEDGYQSANPRRVADLNVAHVQPLPPAQAFLATVLCAFIAAGKVGLDPDEIAAAIDTVRAGCRRARQINGGGNAQH
jgi:UDP-N-acetylmuramyl tripeptide synthase